MPFLLHVIFALPNESDASFPVSLKGLISNKSNEVEKEVQEKVKKLCANFPIYKF